MILLNTTFVCDPALEAEVKAWIKDTYISSAIASGSFSRPIASKVFPMPDSDASSLAVQMLCSTPGQANSWLAGEGMRLCEALSRGRRDRIMHFSTMMDIFHDHAD